MVVETALYERLGVTHDASTDQIRRSYRQAALLWHPDRNRDNPEAAEKFKACLEAYEILSNPNQRTLYDAYGLSGVLRTASDSEVSPETRSAQPPRSSSSSSRAHRQRQYRQRPPPPTTFDQDFDDDDFFVFPQPMHFEFPQQRQTQARQTQTQTQSQSQSQSQSQQTPRFSFSSSFSFSTSTSSGGGGGSYSTHTQSWNSRDGHQSRRTSGTFGPGGNGSRQVDNSGGVNNNRRSYHRTSSHDGYADQNVAPHPQNTFTQNTVQAQGMQSQAQGMQSQAQGMQSQAQGMGGGFFDLGSNFNNIFAGMSNNFSSFFGNNVFGEPDPTTRPQQSRRPRQ